MHCDSDPPINILTRCASAPASVYDPTDDRYSSRSSSRSSAVIPLSTILSDGSHTVHSVSAVPSTKYSSEFPVALSLKHLSLFNPGSEPEFQKPWRLALHMHTQNVTVPAYAEDDSDSINVPSEPVYDVETPTQEDYDENPISNAWKNPYPTSWLEMGTDESGHLDWDDENSGSTQESASASENQETDCESVAASSKASQMEQEEDVLDGEGTIGRAFDTEKPLPNIPRKFPNTILLRTKEIGVKPIIRRTRSQTVPQRAQTMYGVPSPLPTGPDRGQIEYLNLAEARSLYHAGTPLARVYEKGEGLREAGPEALYTEGEKRARFDVTEGVVPQWGRSSFPSRVTFLPTLKRSSSSMRSLENFWEQKFGRNDSEMDLKSKGKGKARKRDRLLRPFKRMDSVQEESTSDATSIPEPNIVPPLFAVDSIPNAAETTQATYIRVFNEGGASVSFGTILSGEDVGDGNEKVKTIVCFIRHFLCPMCQDYMYSIGRNVDPEALKQAGLRLVIVGNGGWQMIKGYRRIFKLPYPIYTDPTATLYTALGMTMRTLDPGPEVPSSTSSSSIVESVQTRPDTYVRHRNLMSGISLVLRNAVKARMPIWRYMGDKALLGGEFVFVKAPGKDITCVWAHRMRYTTAHEEITNVVGEARTSTADMESCLGTECSQSFITAMSSLSDLGSSSATIDRVTLARQMGFLDTSSDLGNTELSLQDYESSASRNVSSIYSTFSTSTSLSSTSTSKQLRDKGPWFKKEKHRWSKMVRMLGKSLDTIDSFDDSQTDFSMEDTELDLGVKDLSHHLEVAIPEIAGDTKDDTDAFERWFQMDLQ